MAKDDEFVKAVKDKEMKWMTGNLPLTYNHKDLLDFTLKLYSNRNATSKWDGGSKVTTKKLNETTKFLAMMLNIKNLKKAMESAKITSSSKTSNKLGQDKQEAGPRFRPWQFKTKKEKTC
eukprot:1901834-Ditylum_brightwellii.AAC.1